MPDTERCSRCGHPLEILSKPVRRLRWSRYWWDGMKSLLTGPMKQCGQCGAIYSNEGQLVAAGAIETEAEQRLNLYRKDMAFLRDSFAGISVAAGVAVWWLLSGGESLELARAIVAGSVGGAALVPFFYFGRKARLARRDLKQLRQARRSGHILKQGS
jgi:hypothetical protein